MTEQVLKQVGVETVGDLQEYAGDLRALVGSFGPRLSQFAFGEDDRALEVIKWAGLLAFSWYRQLKEGALPKN